MVPKLFACLPWNLQTQAHPSPTPCIAAKEAPVSCLLVHEPLVPGCQTCSETDESIRSYKDPELKAKAMAVARALSQGLKSMCHEIRRIRD